MPTLRDSDEEKDGIRERIGQGGAELEDLPLRQSSGPLYDPPEELLGPARRSDRTWGTLAAAAVLMVALLGTFLWYQRPGPSRSTPPPYAPPAEETPEPALEEPDAPPAAAPEVIEEVPAEPEPEPTPEITPEIVPASPAPPRPAPPVQIAAPEPAPETHPRKILSGPPPDRLAGMLRPGPGVEMPVPLELPRARYPEAARGKGLKVDIHLDLLVDEQGKVVDALVREGDSANLGFNEAAVQAALDTRFQPATRWDLPGKAWTELIIEFEEPRLEPERGR